MLFSHGKPGKDSNLHFIFELAFQNRCTKKVTQTQKNVFFFEPSYTAAELFYLENDAFSHKQNEIQQKHLFQKYDFS